MVKEQYSGNLELIFGQVDCYFIFMELMEYLFQMLVMSVFVCVINVDVIVDVFNIRNIIDGGIYFFLEDFCSV